MSSRFAVLGSPIAHSKSPLLHTAAYRELGLDWEYTRAEVSSGELGEFVLGLDDSWRGLSLTMPLKEEALALVDSVDVQSLMTGASNTVALDHSQSKLTVQGFNTDVAGIVGALADVGIRQTSHVLILGAGATARSAMVAAANLGAEQVTVAARSPHKTEEIVNVAARAGLVVSVVHLGDALTSDLVADVTISTLPGGALQLAPDDILAVPRGAVLLDVAYDPWPSVLGTAWRGAGGVTVSGLAMLAHQALGQVRIFVTGDPLLPLDREDEVFTAMKRAVGLPS
ncbi:shikimate dehydrogenase [Subtercola sp. PAMC28395]|uniref:shikimate dehydrogenase n=1 Tax=Subtercola sp. PAMC28395 TaxID=2846775 RepID=UPI001C0D88B4|nr:shikimate dehydrogenase [Subtercola sp. PAMC28395]QWT23349.1 shikimate dehydrogenase [Subtercola sp. PAMC28395]